MSDQQDSRSRQNRGQMGPTPVGPILMFIGAIVALLIAVELQPVIGTGLAVVAAIGLTTIAVNLVYQVRMRVGGGEDDGE